MNRTAAQLGTPTTVQYRQDQKEVSLNCGATGTRNSGNLTLPASQCQVRAGTVVAGALVTEHVYDTATWRFLLIPKDSRILGK